MRRCFAGAVVMAACAALTACAGDKTIKVGEAQPEARKVDIAWKPRRAVAPAQWPSACDLISSKEIKAILPQSKPGQPRPQRVIVNPAYSVGPGGTGRAANGQCSREIEIPHHTGKLLYRLNYMTITIEAVGDPALVAKFFATTKKDEQSLEEDNGLNAPGADACFVHPTSGGVEVGRFICHRGPLMFTVSIGSWHVDSTVTRAQIIPAVIQTITAKV